MLIIVLTFGEPEITVGTSLINHSLRSPVNHRLGYDAQIPKINIHDENQSRIKNLFLPEWNKIYKVVVHENLSH